MMGLPKGMTHCGKCHKYIPTSRFTLHYLTCRGK